MNKNRVRTMRHVWGLNLVSTRLAVLLVVALVIAVTIQAAIPRAVAAQAFSDLIAQEAAFDNVSLPPTATSAQAGTMRTGTRSWIVVLGNRSPTSVTNPTVSIESGYDPSLYNFTWQNQPVTAFPVKNSQSSLTPGQQLGPDGLVSNIPVTFSLGYDSTRTVSPLVIPVGGTQQTVTITVTPIDSRYVPPPNGFARILVMVGSNLPGVTLVSTTNPNNLNQGEVLNTDTNFGLFVWHLDFVQLHKTYRFSAVLHVPNDSGATFQYLPYVNMFGAPVTVLCSDCPGSSVTVKDPTLDGNVPGSGGTTFSVTDTNHTWTEEYDAAYSVLYAGTMPAILPVTIVVKPGSGQPAPINPTSQGVIPVAILSTGSFDATTVDPTTVRFGATGTEASSTQTSLEDVNGDGRLDMVLHFNTQQTGIVCGTTTVTLTGQTTSGQPISGTAPITTVGCG